MPASVIVAVAFLAPGCQRAANTFDATVQGAVTIDGELAPRGTVTFHPQKSGTPSSGPIHSDGSYSIRTGQGDLSNPDGGTIRSGEYVVTVTVTAAPSESEAVPEGGPPSAGARLMADKYAARETSDLKADVKAGPNVIDFKLDGPWANPPKEEVDEGGESVGEAGEGASEASEDPPADEDVEEPSASGGENLPVDDAPTPPSDDAAPAAADDAATTEAQP
jgi:hypothetical protein